MDITEDHKDGDDNGYSYGENPDGQKIAPPPVDMDPKLRAIAMEKFDEHQRWVFNRLPLNREQLKDVCKSFMVSERPIIKRKKRKV
jgi:hypothetical protein